ncbi:MAG: DivIVA domain-containing protein [Oscillospiraceae bacterium]|nr:DivIVA domain-containing protein [Oscillospiraceae bacterium]
MERIFFKEQPNGYDKEQVDNYIRKITEAYQTAYDEYLAACEKYNNLIQDYKKLESEKQAKQSAADVDIIAKTLINSERLAKEIIDNAHTEENRVIELTVKNLQYAYTTLESAMSEVQKFLTFNNAISDEKYENKETGGILDGNEIFKRIEPGISDRD